MILLVTYAAVAVAVVGFAGVGAVTDFDDDTAVLGTRGGGRAGRPLVPGDPGDHHIGPRLDADHDPARLANDPLDVALEGVPGVLRPRARPLPHPARGHDRRRHPDDHLVHRRPAGVGQLLVRQHLLAGVDDRLLLRVHRHRVRDLLPPRARQVDQEPGADGNRPADRRGDADLPVLRVGALPRRSRRLLLGNRGVRDGCAAVRCRGAHPGGSGADAALALRGLRPRGVLRA